MRRSSRRDAIGNILVIVALVVMALLAFRFLPILGATVMLLMGISAIVVFIAWTLKLYANGIDGGKLVVSTVLALLILIFFSGVLIEIAIGIIVLVHLWMIYRDRRRVFA